MDFETVTAMLNTLLARKQPQEFDSSWIRHNAPDCYRFIRGNVRREWGGIDWDRLTFALDKRFQKRWHPRRARNNPVPYEDRAEFETIQVKYQDKLYVFISAVDVHDRRIRDVIGISFVRLAQKGNLLARQHSKSLWVTPSMVGWSDMRLCRAGRDMKKKCKSCLTRAYVAIAIPAHS